VNRRRKAAGEVGGGGGEASGGEAEGRRGSGQIWWDWSRVWGAVFFCSPPAVQNS
jgi:hypothetical protein